MIGMILIEMEIVEMTFFPEEEVVEMNTPTPCYPAAPLSHSCLFGGPSLLCIIISCWPCRLSIAAPLSHSCLSGGPCLPTF
jgi:hypothetical protein